MFQYGDRIVISHTSGNLKAAANFNNFQEKGWLVQDQKECYYVYAQTMNGKTQYGLVVGAYVPDYMNGTIKKHELTRRDKEEDRMKHVRVNNANIEPVFFAYPDNSELDAIVMKYTAREPEYNFVAKLDGFGHTFWEIDFRFNDMVKGFLVSFRFHTSFLRVQYVIGTGSHLLYKFFWRTNSLERFYFCHGN